MKRTYTRGIIGALIGGLIASIPWIFIYVYGEEIYTIFALIIAAGAIKGYQLFKGKVDKKLPFIIATISLICVTIATLVIIPMLILTRAGGSLSLLNLKILYNDPTFVEAIMKDYLVSIIFTIIGISIAISHIIEIIKKNPNKEDLEIPLGGGTKKDKETVKKYFIKRNATTEDTAISINKLAKIKEHSLTALIEDGVIIRKDNKFYYSKNNDETVTASKKKSNKLLTIILSIFLGLFIIISISGPKEPREGDADYRVPKDITFELSNDYIEHIKEENENHWYYIPKSDVSGGTGYINVSYFEGTLTLDTESLKSVATNLKELNKAQKVTYSEPFLTSNILLAVEFKVKTENYTKYVYYIKGTNKIAGIEIIDYNKLDNLLEDGKNLVDTFNWTN